MGPIKRVDSYHRDAAAALKTLDEFHQRLLSDPPMRVNVIDDALNSIAESMESIRIIVSRNQEEGRKSPPPQSQ